MPRPLVKIADRRPRDVCAGLELAEESRAVSESDPSPEDFLRTLIEQERYSDATQYLAHALPKREAVWWATITVREQLERADEVARGVLDAAEAWVRNPNDDNRRAAMKAAEVDSSTPAGMVGVAAFMSGGSIAPAELEEVAAPPALTGVMVASAVILTAVTPDPLAAADKYKRFLAAGIQIAQGPERS